MRKILPMADYQDTYSRMTNDQLLHLAQEADGLTPLAKVVLDIELEKRKLGPAHVAEQTEYLRRVEAEAARQKPLAQTFNGFGTKIYGKRDFESDGSFLTTKWVVFWWIPVVPLKSLRVRYVGPSGRSILPGWSRKYLVQAEYRPAPRQVVSIYSFLLSFLAGGWILDKASGGLLDRLCCIRGLGVRTLVFAVARKARGPAVRKCRWPARRVKDVYRVLR